jgi:hypothetical protein
MRGYKCHRQDEEIHFLESCSFMYVNSINLFPNQISNVFLGNTVFLTQLSLTCKLQPSLPFQNKSFGT